METFLVIALCILVAFAIFCVVDEIRVLKSNCNRYKNNWLTLWHKQNQNQVEQTQMQTMTPAAIRTELDSLIGATKGKFFSITFVKNDGTTRIVNGKDKYNRLLNGGSDTGRQAGFVPFVNRNTETWVSAHKDRVVTFRCGKLEKSMKVSA